MREEIELFGGTEQLVGCRHVPAGGAHVGVLICLSSPFDGAVDEGRSARLGRALARSGVVVQRFHYRGVPPSDGDPADVGFASLVDDARRALELLLDRCPVERVGFVGARLGALVAARVASDRGDAPLVLWEPVTDPLEAVETAAQGRVARPRLHVVRNGSVGRDGAGPPPDPGTGPVPVGGEPGPVAVDGGAMRPPPPIDLLDTPLGADLADAAVVAGLAEEVGDRPRPLLVVQTGPGHVLRPRYSRFVDRCRARGLAADHVCHPCDGERDGVPVPASTPGPLVDDTGTWLISRLGTTGGSP